MKFSSKFRVFSQKIKKMVEMCRTFLPTLQTCSEICPNLSGRRYRFMLYTQIRPPLPSWVDRANKYRSGIMSGTTSSGRSSPSRSAWTSARGRATGSFPSSSRCPGLFLIGCVCGEGEGGMHVSVGSLFSIVSKQKSASKGSCCNIVGGTYNVCTLLQHSRPWR